MAAILLMVVGACLGFIVGFVVGVVSEKNERIGK